MRWVRYEADGEVVYGILEGNDIAEVSGTPFESHKPTGKTRALDAVKLLVPVVPPTFYAAGINYMDHIIDQAKLTGTEPKVPKKADIGYRAVNALVAHDEPIVIPKDATDKVHYEGEIVVVIGREAKNLSEENALSCVLGYTIGNDVSERSWQAEDRTLWRAKNTDSFKPMGPWIETDLKLDDLTTTVRLNGEERIRFPTNKMVFGVETYIAAMTRYMTLHPGDVIWMGTDGASPNLEDGDVVEVEISGIGVLRNPVVREK